MDGRRFDELTRAYTTGASRRRVLGVLAGGLATALGERSVTRAKKGKVGVCHRTDDSANPYTYIEVSENAVREHRAHGDAIAPDFQTDPNNCGECGNVCGAGETCTAGGCESTSGCAPGGGCVEYGEACTQNSDCASTSAAPRVCRPPDSNSTCTTTGASGACCLNTAVEGGSCDEPADCRDFGRDPECVEVTCENNVCASRGVPCCEGQADGEDCFNISLRQVCCGGICCEVGQGCTNGQCQ